FGLLADMQRSNDQATASSLQSKEILRQAQVVSRSLREAGTAVRGSILTGDPDLAAAYGRAAQQVQHDILELQNRVSDNPEQFAQAQAVATAARELVTWHAENIRLARTGNRMQAVARARTSTTSRLQEELRQALTTFIQTEDRL